MIATLQPGLLTTVQDEGRWGYQAYGMPVAGAMDRYAYRVANLLVGNKPGAAGLEMTLRGGTFRFEAEALVAICGADMGAELNGQPVAAWSSFQAPPGSVLSFGFAAAGCRTYIAVRGGIDVPLVLGSRSTYIRGGVGGLNGRALKAGDVLPVGGETAAPARPQRLDPRFIPQYGGAANGAIELRVLLGPQDDCFTAQGLATLFGSTYTISPDADRMGYRLDGPVIEHSGKPDIVSDALCQGAIQVPGHGMPIIMMADRQTTGGYTKIGTVIGPDLTKLAQAKPGDNVVFKKCSDEEAVEALRRERQIYAEIAQSLNPAAAKEYPEYSPAAPPLAARLEIARRVFTVKVNGEIFHVEIEEER